MNYGRLVIFPPGTLVSSTNKTDHHDIAEKLLKVVLSTITITLTHFQQLFLDMVTSRFIGGMEPLTDITHSPVSSYLYIMSVVLDLNNSSIMYEVFKKNVKAQFIGNN